VAKCNFLELKPFKIPFVETTVVSNLNWTSLTLGFEHLHFEIPFFAKKTGAMRQRVFEHTERPELHGWIHHV